MPSYSTIEEKAAEWKISVRHIQHLCRSGKIKGAVKRAGAWAIPDDIPTPAKNTKSNDREFKFVGTKNKIFDSAIKLSVQKGFSNLSFKDIANSIGVRQSTVYGHFKAKQDILDAIYGFYCHFYIQERIDLKDMETVIQKESLWGIIKYIRYEFKEEYRQRMLDITKIILQRIGTDECAREIVGSVMIKNGIEYVESIFDKAVEIGRLAPFDTHAMAVFINAVRMFTLYCWVIEPEALPDKKKKLLEDEEKLYVYALNFLIDLNSPDKRKSINAISI